MSEAREFIAEHRRTPVRLNLGELNVLLEAALENGVPRKREEPDLHAALVRVERARDRRLRAAERAAGR